MRTAIVLGCCALTLAACTTSTAVLTWHEAWKAEQVGDLERAERGYAAAFERDPSLVGAQCNRIRLVAAHPDRATQAQTALDALIKAKAAAPEVAVTSAWAALADGKPEVARKRLDAARKLTDLDRPDVHAASRATRLRVLGAQGQFAEALASARAVDRALRATADREFVAVVGWNGDDVALAESAAPEGAEVAVWTAAARGDHRKVVARARQLDRAAAAVATLAIVAWSQARSGDRDQAAAWLAQAQGRDPGDATATQVAAALALADGQAALARDALAGLVARMPAAPAAAWFNLAVAQLRLGDPAAAHHSFARAAAACPTCTAAARNRDVLAMLVGEGQ